jgi:hypothetical protein
MSIRACWISIGLVAAALALSLNQPARAQDHAEIGRGVFCNTAVQAEKFVALDGDSKAVEQVNREEPDACMIAFVAFVRGKDIKERLTQDGIVSITEILVFAYNDGEWHGLTPLVRYTLFRVENEVGA